MKIAIVGNTGMLGSTLYKYFTSKSNIKCYGTMRSKFNDKIFEDYEKENIFENIEIQNLENLKTILGTGELGTLRNVAKASLICMMAGADFIKTSTGKEPQNATLPVSLVMLRMIRDYHQKTGHKVGFKPAGGIRTAKQALEWQILMNEELGREWLEPELFRFGASGLLTDIERQLEHFVTGRYSAAYLQPMG